MRAKRDTEFAAFRSETSRLAHETDLCLLLEAADRTTLDLALRAVQDVTNVRVQRAHIGQQSFGNRDPFGFTDGVSNLQDLRRCEGERYTDLVFCRAADGEIAGTYLVFRRYRCFPERLAAGLPVVIADKRGRSTRVLRPDQLVGRCRQTGSVVSEQTGELLRAEADERQGAYAFHQSHLRKANPRGSGFTSFGHPVRVDEARILRRSYTYALPGPAKGNVEHGMLFLAFQSDIQHRGFEFIHNEWLMSDFNGAPDPLLAPEAGLVEPLTGCYYFVPRRQDDIAAELATLLSQ
jgi:Dyp-type peroxidase family